MAFTLVQRSVVMDWQYVNSIVHLVDWPNLISIRRIIERKDPAQYSLSTIPCALRMADLPLPAAPPLPVPFWVIFLNIGAFFNMSGSIKNRILLPRIKTCSSCEIRPSLAVTVMFVIWQFILSSASTSFPLYTSPVIVSSVTICPSASCRILIGTPIDILG